MHLPLMVAVAPNGARKTKTDHANLPIAPLEIAETAVECLAAGSCMIHLHVRNDDNQHSLDPLRYKSAIQAIREKVKEDLIIQITAGFDYKSSDSVSVEIDNNSYDFYADEDTAWASDDTKVIYAMKKGLKLTTTGISSKGTKVIDTYTLKGFTAAYNKLTADC